MTRPFTRIVSHRGGALLWPENSLEAFKNSLLAGVDALECDVHLSSDGIPMVIHDAMLDRTTMATGPVAAETAAALGQTALRSRHPATIPSLGQVADLLRGREQGLQVEVKGTGRHDLLNRSLEVLDASGIRSQASIIAFDTEIAGAAVLAGGLAEVVWLFEASRLRSIGPAGIIATAEAHGVGAVETDIGTLDAELCLALHQGGLRVGAWGANDRARLRTAFELGLALVATDDPVLALTLRPR